MTELEVTNIVGMISYHQEFDLAGVVRDVQTAERNHGRHLRTGRQPLVTDSFAPDDTYVSFYRTGRYSIAGCRSIEHVDSFVTLDRSPRQSQNSCTQR